MTPGESRGMGLTPAAAGDGGTVSLPGIGRVRCVVCGPHRAVHIEQPFGEHRKVGSGAWGFRTKQRGSTAGGTPARGVTPARGATAAGRLNVIRRRVVR